jgi:hypothetical protein
MLSSSGRKSSSKGRGGGNKSKAGLAALAGVAGFALKNRSKLTSRFGANKNPGHPQGF